MKKERRYTINELNFWIYVASKIVGSFVSISVWGFILVLFIATWLNHTGTIDSVAWATVISIGFPSFLAYRSIGDRRYKEDLKK